MLLQEATTLRKQNANLQAALSKSQEESAVLAARLEEAHAAAADNQQLLAVVRSRISVLEKAYAAAVEVSAPCSLWWLWQVTGVLRMGCGALALL